MYETFTLLPKLFVDKMIKKMDELPHQSCGSVIKSYKMERIKSTTGTNVCGKINGDKYFVLC